MQLTTGADMIITLGGACMVLGAGLMVLAVGGLVVYIVIQIFRGEL